ncbi:MAG: N-acetylglucosamine-6-phosphate deacetylase [Sphingomonadales bacterium]
MSLEAIQAPAIMTPSGLVHGQAVLVAAGRVQGLCAASAVPAGALVHAWPEGVLLPGLIDVQVNGGGGVLFNDQPSIAGIEAIAAAHRHYGTTALLPTLISSDRATMAAAIQAVDAAIAQAVPGVLGIHLEGPFLAPAKAGIHDAGHFAQLDQDGIDLLCSLKRGKTLVTLAPEQASPEAIRALAAAGVIIALGHSNASYEQAMAAIEAGASGVTHLYNAMSGLGSRAPGLVGAALDSDVWAGVIADGIHVHPAALKLAVRAKGARRVMLVTDAMPSVGAAANQFRLNGETITLRDGRLTNDAGVLAGSHLNMAQALDFAADQLGLGLEAAVTMASAAPASFLGLDGELGAIRPGARANLLLLDGAGQPRQCWIDGIAFPH